MSRQKNLEQTREYIERAKIAAMQLDNCSDERFVVLCEDSRRAEIRDNTKQFIGRVAASQPDVLLYLDKSTRPYSWLIRRVLGAVEPDYQPQTRYINIGMEKVDDFGWLGKKKYKKPSQLAVVDELRHTYRDPKSPNMTVFAGKDVLIVDDFIVSGQSLDFAQRLVLSMTERDGLEAAVSTHYISSTVSPWHATTGMIGVEDSPRNPFLVVPGPGNFTHQLRAEMDYLAADIVTDLQGNN